MTDESAKSSWVAIVPMENLMVSDDSPINGKWQVGDVEFVSSSKLINYGNPIVERLVQSDPFVERFSSITAFGVVRTEGNRPAHEHIVSQINDAASITMATDTLFGGRHFRDGFSVLGSPLDIIRSSILIDACNEEMHIIWKRNGRFMPWKMDVEWHKNISETGMINLFAAITDAGIDPKWRAQIRRAAICIGRSQMALELSDAFLLDIIALETLLTRQCERSGKMLSKRIKGMTGWHLGLTNPNFEKEILDIFDMRNGMVHDAIIDAITEEHLGVADQYAAISLLNVAMFRGHFPEKDLLVDMLDRCVFANDWKVLEGKGVLLRWIEKHTETNNTSISLE